MPTALTDGSDTLSVTFAALADPTRRSILSRLANGEATVNELAEPFDVSLQAVSKHLQVLERAGLITRGRRAQFRPCRLEADRLGGAAEWIDRHRRVWQERFDKLEAHLADIQRPGADGDSPDTQSPIESAPPIESPLPVECKEHDHDQ